VICPLIAAERNVTPEHAWVRRHRERKFWYDWANEYRKDDPAKLAKKCLEHGDMVIGLRDKLELQACKDANLFDLIVWIHRDVPKDPTVTFEAADCHITLDNTRSKRDLYAKLEKLCYLFGVPVYAYPDPQKNKLPDWAYKPALSPDEQEEPFGASLVVARN
jgi:hypothetical protein